jgi:hypothetical protein
MSEPIRDAEALGRILDKGFYPEEGLAWEENNDGWRDRCCRGAEAVRDAVCPPGWKVVPAAELDALLAQVKKTIEEPAVSVDAELTFLERAYWEFRIAEMVEG